MGSAEVNEERKGRKKGGKGKREKKERKYIFVCPQANEMITIKWNALTVTVEASIHEVMVGLMSIYAHLATESIP